MQNIFYSIIVVCLNSGQRLFDTLDSIVAQQYDNYEIVIKDGGSKDGSTEKIAEKYPEYQDKIRLYTQKDTGIYDAMNQAAALAEGEYFLFLNTGDLFFNDRVLADVTEELAGKEEKPGIVYGNLYHRALETIIYASPVMNDFTCYRNVPCHQTCFYRKDLFAKRAYDPKYNVRADYEHFLWCFYEEKTLISYVPVVVASYEGGGYSETPKARKQSKEQHKEITLRYMGKAKVCKFRLIMLLTLAPLRSKIAESESLSKIYNKIKTWIYKIRA